MINQYVKIDLDCRGKGLIISIVILFFSFSLINGQNDSQKSQLFTRQEAPPFKERLFFGGSFSFQLGTITDIELSPVAGLWVLPRVAVALGPTYRFYKYVDEKTNIFGGRSYVQYVFFKDIDKFIPLGTHTSLFVHLEDEMLSLDSRFWRNVSLKPHRFMINTVLAGAGLSQPIGERASINFMLLWALNDSGYDIYSNPIMRLSFVF